MVSWRKIEGLASREALAKLIEEEGTPLRIAKRLGCPKTSVKNAMRHHGLSGKRLVASREARKRLWL